MIPVALLSPDEYAGLLARVVCIEVALPGLINLKEKVMVLSDTVAALESQVAETTGVTQSAIVLIEGIRTELAAIAAELALQGASTARIESAIATLDAQEQALAAAVAANPAAVPPVA